MPLPAFSAPPTGRSPGSVAGSRGTLGVDVTLVRLVFALLALAGGAGIVLYLALWLYADGRPVWLAGLGVVLSGTLLLHAVGLSDRAVAGIALVGAGLAVAWRRGGGLRPDAPLSYAGYALVGIGAVRPPCGSAETRRAASRAGCGCRRRSSSSPGRGCGGSRSTGTPSGPRGSAARSAPTSPRASTIRCCRRSR